VSVSGAAHTGGDLMKQPSVKLHVHTIILSVLCIFEMKFCAYIWPPMDEPAPSHDWL
jgi:hypothetical protein